uniref:hypothetical protein n=1 Tax=Singulisphaera acidiphila TaxID=466153 RepID=UPI00137705E6|nr:hypothetical protein [Singulisphaera acidiphila]
MAQPPPGQARNQAKWPVNFPLVPSRQATFRRRVLAANSLRLTGRVAPSANRGRFRGRPPVPPGFSTGPGNSHLGSSVKTTC